jgi:hypothetical protein
MNRIEKQVLHGLWFRYEVPDSKVSANVQEIKWLFENSIPRTRDWTYNGKLRVGGNAVDHQVSGVPAEIVSVFRMLAAKGYVSFEVKDRVVAYTVTALGAEEARKLDSLYWRIDGFYRAHRDGLLSLVFTVAVAAATAYLTALFSPNR